MPPISRKDRKSPKDDGKTDAGIGYLEGKVQERVQPVVKALHEMRPVFEANTRAIQELTKEIRERR